MSRLSVADVGDLRRLREEGKTLREIADIYGCKSVNAIACLINYGERTKPVKPVTNPRDVLLPELVKRLPKGAVAAWRKHGVCLCGCGEKTSIRNIDSHLGRRGEHCLFKSGHDMKLYPACKAGWKHKPQSLDKMRASMLAKGVEAGWIGELVMEYRRRENLTQRQFAAMAGVSRSLVPEIETGRHKRIRKSTAVLILNAIGEKVRPDLLTDTPHKVIQYVDERTPTPQGRSLHSLMYDGRAFQDYWGNVIYGRSPGEAGIGKCSCGVKSPVFEKDRERRRWHAQHRVESEASVA